MKCRILLILIFFLCFFASAQIPDKKQDKMSDDFELLKKAGKTAINNPEKSAGLVKKVITSATKSGNDTLLAEAYSLSGKLRYYAADYDSSLTAWKTALQIYLKNGNDKGIAEQYNNLGVWYYAAASDFDKALEYYLKSLEKREQINDSTGIAYSLSNIGNIYSKQKRNKKAVESFEKALLYAENGNDKNIISILFNNLGVEYELEKDFDKALDYYLKSAKIKKELNYLSSLALTYINIGSIYKDTEKYDKALEYYRKSLDLLNKNPDKYYIGLLYNYMATVSKRQKKYGEALKYLEKSQNTAFEINDKILLRDNFKEFTEIYSKLKNYKKAFENQKMYIAYHDTVFNEESDKRMKETEVKYETEKKEKENEILKRQQQINELKLEKKTTGQYYLIAGTVLLLVLIAVIYGRYRYKQKTNLILEETNRKLLISEKNLKETVDAKDKFFSIIAHDLRNPLSSLSLVSGILDENTENFSEEKLKYYIGSINNAADSLLNLVENLLSWARTQTNRMKINQEKIDLREIVEQNIKLMKFGADKKEINIENKIEEGTYVFADINLLTAVIRNLTANALKFTGKGGTIKIYSQNKGDKTEVYVEDSGIGIAENDLKKLFRIDVDTNSIGNSSEKGTGLGLILCKEFTEMNGGTIRAESEEGKGSKFIFTLKKA